MSEHMTANEDGTFTVHVHGPVADKMIALLAKNSDLREALAKSASREAALVEKLKVAEAALARVASIEAFFNPRVLDPEHDRELISRMEYADVALAKIKEAS